VTRLEGSPTRPGGGAVCGGSHAPDGSVTPDHSGAAVVCLAAHAGRGTTSDGDKVAAHGW